MDITFREMLPVLAVLAGAITGGLIAELRTLSQGARERRRALRILLYELLELRFRVARQNPAQFLPELKACVERTLGAETARSLDSPDANRFLRHALVAAAAVSLDPSIGARYEHAVDAVAPHDPVFAYGLRSQSFLLNVERGITAYYEKVSALPDVLQDPNAAFVLPQAESATLDLARAEALTRLASDIRAAAWRIGLSVRYRTGRIIRRQDRPPASDLREAMDAFLHKVMAQIGENR